MLPKWAAFSPSSATSSASTSPSDSPLKGNSKRKLIRQPKLRHVGDDELGVWQVKSLPASPEKGSGSSWFRSRHHWSRSAVPQPLPLPELSSTRRCSRSCDNLPLPREGPSCRGELDPSSSPAITGNSFQGILGKSSDDLVRRSSKSPTYRRRGFFNGLNVEGVRRDFTVNIPARSAPSSGFSSPALSPRFSTVDFHYPFRASSALETSPQDRVTGSPPPLLPTKLPCSPDHSPVRSPTSQNPCMNVRKNNGAALHSYHKSHSETWFDGNNANVHPLPLPPGVLRPSQSSLTYQNVDKSDVSPVIAQWKKGKLIGRGTYGSVYVATNCKTGALCAMKEVDLVPDDSKAQECIKQLEQEIKVLRQFKHPNIVQYYGSGTIEDRFCIYLEYVHPGSINKYVRDHCGAMTESIVRNFTRHIVSGLAYLHSKKTIHRDIKGANLLVDANGVVKLADFGLAKHLTGHATDLSLKGSPHWMAPEVLQAAMRKDTNSELAYGVDIWSLGCTVIEMLTGKPPWSEFNGVQAMFNVLHRSPHIPETLSPEGKDFLQRCFQRRPEDRPSAAVLLGHAFLRNSCDQNVASCLEEFSGVTLSDKPQSPKDSIERTKNLMSDLPSLSVKNREVPHNSECLQSSPQVSDFGFASRQSPCSTLDVSSPELNSTSRNISPPDICNSLPAGTGINKRPFDNIYVFGCSVDRKKVTKQCFGKHEGGKTPRWQV
ncbi:mitogen-activated protein kinase kinase kinase 5-like isoform X1 [Coffea arabica]|uniref:mitogen-activated protein kinase kinase kinase n=1 Tax=Coffea arabica TaxID=13443 RepID=A0A6P6UNP5_COFAR|nr:mitogen-activated protein kinase kinase kinase 5-like [Coffea arabica]